MLLSRKVIHEHINPLGLMPIIIDELELRILINALYLDAHRLVVRGIL